MRRRVREAWGSMPWPGHRAILRRSGVLGWLLFAWCGRVRVKDFTPAQALAFYLYERVRMRRAAPAIEARLAAAERAMQEEVDRRWWTVDVDPEDARP